MGDAGAGGAAPSQQSKSACALAGALVTTLGRFGQAAGLASALVLASAR